MKVILKELSLNDGNEIYEMIQEFGLGENGFTNRLYSDCFEHFRAKLKRYNDNANGINVSPGYVPQTIYWLLIDDKPVGYAKLRHYLNENLRKMGGHIGYAIRPSARRNGYGKIILNELLKKAKEKNIYEVLITCDEVNIPSRKIIESNGGQLIEAYDGICQYMIRQ